MIIARAYITIANVSDGPKGDTGDNALTLVCTPASLTFETNRDGEIENTTQRKVQVVLYEGQTAVTPTSTTVTPYNCYARLVEQNIVVDGISPNQWSGHIAITATYKGQTRTARVEFVVSAQKWNETKFEANQKQFQSIIAQNKADKQGLEQKISTIKQTADNIQLEVRKQTFSGVNLLKGASLRPLNLLSLQRAQYVTIVKYPSVAHFDNPYLSISRHGATQDEWNGCKFPIVTIQSGKTYTLSMFVRIYGSDQPYIEIKRSKSKDMSAPKTSYPNIPSSYGVWKPYTHTFDMEDGYNYLQIFIGCTRNGEAYISEIQLEEGTKATTWKDPDVIESIKRAGVNITLGRIEARADNFVIRNSEGKLTTVIDENGQLIAGSLRTQDRGNGYMTLEGNQQSFFKHGIPHPMRWIGYTSEGWVERMYDDVGNLIWENGVNGQIFKMRPERWEDIASHVIVHGISTLDYFFNIHGTNALSKIFQSNKDEQYNVYKYHAARDVRGNIIATSQTNPIQSVRDSDGVLFSQKDIKGTKFSGIIRTNIITLCTVNYRSNNSSMTIEEDQEERRSLEISADFIRSRIEELRKKFSLYNTYNVEVRIGVPLYCTQIAVYKDGILTGDYYLYANEKDVNKNNLNM